MSRNVNTKLNKAREVKNDEFYTQYKDIEEECKHYIEQFKDKIIYLNCDKANFSNFYFYFKDNFINFGLKKLISTSYKSNKKYEITNEDGYLKECCYTLDSHKDFEDGDFRSPECMQILLSSDIIITNPPFSLFRELIITLLKFTSLNKKFLIMGGMTAMGNRPIFKGIFEKQIKLGHNNKELTFLTPNNELKRVAICWYTNLEVNKKTHIFPLTKKYNKEEYPKYDNFDAIEVGKIKDIPVDYDGLMGVPITYLKKLHNKQFEMLGIDLDFERKRFTLNGLKLFSRVLIKRIINEQ